MTHQGYFDWDCAACGRRRKGDLPPRGDADGGDDDAAARP
jgi:hypothetical protein